MTKFGELRIVASQDIGELGPKEGKAVIYNWKWYHSVLPLSLFFTLVLILVFVRANRTPRAWLIFVPLLIVNLLWSLLSKILGVGSANMVVFSVLFHSYTVGIASLLLLGHKIANRRRFITFLLALAIMAVASLIGVISYGMTDFSNEGLAIIIILGVLALSMLLGFVLSGRRCRNHYSNLRFMLWLALWCVVVCTVITAVFYSIMFVISGSSVPILILLAFVLIGLVFGLCAYVIIVPYMILAFRSPFFRQRFYDCFHLPATAALSTDESEADAPKQNNIGDLGSA
ncbi:MAG: hypothetical protein ACYSWZ_02895 [Planctomycetota bacterium]